MTDADRIAALEEENAYLRSELGLVLEATRIEQVRARFELEPAQAKIVLRLYQAKGRVVPGMMLLDHLREDVSQKALGVHVHRLRKAVGEDFVETVFGRGYRLTPRGLGLVAAALSEQARAA